MNFHTFKQLVKDLESLLTAERINVCRPSDLPTPDIQMDEGEIEKYFQSYLTNLAASIKKPEDLASGLNIAPSDNSEQQKNNLAMHIAKIYSIAIKGKNSSLVAAIQNATHNLFDSNTRRNIITSATLSSLNLYSFLFSDIDYISFMHSYIVAISCDSNYQASKKVSAQLRKLVNILNQLLQENNLGKSDKRKLALALISLISTITDLSKQRTTFSFTNSFHNTDENSARQLSDLSAAILQMPITSDLIVEILNQLNESSIDVDTLKALNKNIEYLVEKMLPPSAEEIENLVRAMMKYQKATPIMLRLLIPMIPTHLKSSFKQFIFECGYLNLFNYLLNEVDYLKPFDSQDYLHWFILRSRNEQDIHYASRFKYILNLFTGIPATQEQKKLLIKTVTETGNLDLFILITKYPVLLSEIDDHDYLRLSKHYVKNLISMPEYVSSNFLSQKLMAICDSLSLSDTTLDTFLTELNEQKNKTREKPSRREFTNIDFWDKDHQLTLHLKKLENILKSKLKPVNSAASIPVEENGHHAAMRQP